MSIYGWMDKEDVVYIFNGILLILKENEIIPFAGIWINLEIIILSEVQKEKDKFHLYQVCVESELWHRWTSLHNRNRLFRFWYPTDSENRLAVAKDEGEEGEEGVEWEFGVSRCKLLYREWINSKVLLHSTENCIPYPVINHRGKEYEKKNVCICV